MASHYTCVAEPEKHGAWRREKLATVKVGEDAKHSVSAERYACPLCRIDGGYGWVRVATKEEAEK